MRCCAPYWLSQQMQPVGGLLEAVRLWHVLHGAPHGALSSNQCLLSVCMPITLHVITGSLCSQSSACCVELELLGMELWGRAECVPWLGTRSWHACCQRICLLLRWHRGALAEHLRSKPPRPCCRPGLFILGEVPVVQAAPITPSGTLARATASGTTLQSAPWQPLTSMACSAFL